MLYPILYFSYFSIILVIFLLFLKNYLFLIIILEKHEINLGFWLILAQKNLSKPTYLIFELFTGD